MAVDDRTPLLPRTQQQDPSPSKKWENLSRMGPTLAAACVCFALLTLWGVWPLSNPPQLTTFKRDATLLLPSHLQQSVEVFNFLVVGDWGRKGLYNQSLVANQMGKIGEELGIEFVISVGDNFYEEGLTGEDDAAFSLSFTDIYTASSLQTTWYTVLGNHDYRGDVLSQLSDALVKRDWRWYCKRSFQLNHSLCRGSDADTCNSVDIFFFDTTPFIDKYWISNTSKTYNWSGLAPREQQLQSQLRDLSQNLNSSSATWKIVVGHHTVRSVGYHGDSHELIEKLLPILEEYEVDAYINGHDHNVQHIKRQDCTVHFFTSGGGSKSHSGLYPYTESQGVQFAYDGQGFLAVSMRAESVSFTFYNVLGDAIYNYLLHK